MPHHDRPESAAGPPPDSLTVDRRRLDGVEVLTVAGEVDLLTVDDLAAALTPQAEHAEHHGATVLDLTAVTFLDSSGINTILRASRDADSAGTRLLVVADLETDTDTVGRPLRLSGADSLLSIVPTVAAALSRIHRR
ncbi:STAS domain-containing protein [Amycolatopsis sp.]|uniref:STAS domain-containing protein n=1 Tax=Amycolatopsis sp. TaxID=37632 RepID=UPI002D7F6CE5|nr:STAS domain-containing protein [Amycolatopsis sp.]HET6704094.1 STAS domain-containing protein [Amycolatopsis sp.]